MGSKTKLTPELQTEILQALRSGCTRTDAAMHARIHPDTFGRWYQRGEEAEAPFDEFRRAVDKTERDVKIRAAGILHKAMEGDWKAAAWWLERKFPDEYGRRDRVRLEAKHEVAGELTIVDHRIKTLLADPTVAQVMDGVLRDRRGAGNGNGSAAAATRASSEE